MKAVIAAVTHWTDNPTVIDVLHCTVPGLSYLLILSRIVDPRVPLFFFDFDRSLCSSQLTGGIPNRDH